MASGTEIGAAFERAADELKAAGLAGRVAVTDVQKLTLYGLFKQATEGDCTKSQPSKSLHSVALCLSVAYDLRCIADRGFGLHGLGCRRLSASGTIDCWSLAMM